MYGTDNEIYERIEHEAQQQRDRQNAMLDAAGPALLAYGFYRAHRADEEYLETLSPVELEKHHARRRKARLAGLAMLALGALLIFAVGGWAGTAGVVLAVVGLARLL